MIPSQLALFAKHYTMDRTPGVAPKPSAPNDLEKGSESPLADDTKNHLPSPEAAEYDDRSKYVGSPIATTGKKIDDEAILAPPLPVVKTNVEAWKGPFKA
jgi:hypothetical protein